MWLCSNKVLLTQIGYGLNLDCGLSFAKPRFRIEVYSLLCYTDIRDEVYEKNVSPNFSVALLSSSVWLRIHYAREGMLLKPNDLGSLSVLGIIFPLNINYSPTHRQAKSIVC